MTLIFSGFRAVVKGHVLAKCRQAASSGSCVIVLTERKKTRMKTIRSFATARTVKYFYVNGIAGLSKISMSGEMSLVTALGYSVTARV